MPKAMGNNRINTFNRFNRPYSINNTDHRTLFGWKNSSINDARQISINRNKTSFNGRQILNRQSSKNDNNNNNEGEVVIVTGLKDMKIKDGQLISTAISTNPRLKKNKKVFAVGPSTFVTIPNNNNSNPTNANQLTKNFSFTKTITNPSIHLEDNDNRSQTSNTSSSLSNPQVVISFVNDKYQKSPTPPPIITASVVTNSSPPLIYQRTLSPPIKRLHDASIQTVSSSTSSRSPIRMSIHRRQNNTMTDEQDYSIGRMIDDDLYEPPVKRTAVSTKTTTVDLEQQGLSTRTSTDSVKRTPTGAPMGVKTASSISIVPKKTPTPQTNSTPGTILVTNLQSSVTEDDVIELFGQIGCINEVQTLRQGCIQITYAKREFSELAVKKYHNRLLDGQFMYVSLQQPSAAFSTTTTTQNSKTLTNTQRPSAASLTTTTTQNSKTLSNTQRPSAVSLTTTTTQNSKTLTNTQQPSTASLTTTTQNSKTSTNTRRPSEAPSTTTTQNSKTLTNTQRPTKENESSVNSSSPTTNQPLKFNTTTNSFSKTTLDPAFMRQALFHPSTSTHPVQFQVKL